MADVNKLDDLLSLHNGSNHNARGAVHVDYQLPEQGQMLNLRISC